MKLFICIVMCLIAHNLSATQWQAIKTAEDANETSVISSNIYPKHQTKFLNKYHVNLVYQCGYATKTEQIYFSLQYNDDLRKSLKLGIKNLIGKEKYRSSFYFDPRAESNQVEYTLEDGKFITPTDQKAFLDKVLNSTKLSFYLSVSWLDVDSNFIVDLSNFKPYYDAARKSCAIN